MPNEEVLKEFLAEYGALCRKWGLYISACGCCDGPWVNQVEDLDMHLRHLKSQGLEGPYVRPDAPAPAVVDNTGGDYPDGRAYPFQVHIACRTLDELRQKLPGQCPLNSEGRACE
jgi:hypothetical protein